MILYWRRGTTGTMLGRWGAAFSGSLVHLRRHFKRGEGPGDEVASLKTLIYIVEVIEKCPRIGGLRKHTTLVACHATPTSKGAAVGLSPLIETKEF